MKSKKARKRLRRVEGLLTAVIDNFNVANDGIRDLLGTAKAAVADAVTTLERQVERKPPTRATKPGQRGLTAAGRRRLSQAAKKRWAVAKQKGRQDLSNRPLRKTA